MSRAELTAERLRELLHYDADAGLFYWLRRAPGRRLGRPAGVVGKVNGYRLMCIDGKRHKASRLAWLWVHGRWPAECIDHIDGDRANDAIGNLREATHSENMQNRAKSKGKSSKFMGVNWYAPTRKWHAGIRADGKRINLGYFDSEQDAAEAYAAAKRDLHAFQPEVRPRPKRRKPATRGGPVLAIQIDLTLVRDVWPLHLNGLDGLYASLESIRR